MLEGDELHEPMTLSQVVNRFTLRDMMERGETDEELDQVQLMTLHASKGLEFPHVFWLAWKRGSCLIKVVSMKITLKKSGV